MLPTAAAHRSAGFFHQSHGVRGGVRVNERNGGCEPTRTSPPGHGQALLRLVVRPRLTPGGDSTGRWSEGVVSSTHRSVRPDLVSGMG